eukprot:SM000281S10758  [mRNA]  locus=s281:84733:86484:- [translate_table: standard]
MVLLQDDAKRDAHAPSAAAAGPREERPEARQEIPEEDALCRICLAEVGKEGMQMECACRGELALAHRLCAFKWFGIRGNRTCEVCGVEVRNLPVTLVRLAAPPSHDAEVTSSVGLPRPVEVARWRWPESIALGFISMPVYVLYFQFLLLGDMSKQANYSTSIPFGVGVGIVTSLATCISVSERVHLWLFPVIQFGLVALFSHLLFDTVQMGAAASIVLAALIGMGITMGLHAFLLDFLPRVCYGTRASSDAEALQHLQNRVARLQARTASVSPFTAPRDEEEGGGPTSTPRVVQESAGWRRREVPSTRPGAVPRGASAPARRLLMMRSQ